MLASGQWDSCNGGTCLAAVAPVDPALCKKADLDNNGDVNIFDYLKVINAIRSSGDADVNSDGKTNIFDSLKVLSLMNSC